MRTVRLGREFDAVFVHDAVCYMATEEDLRRAIETAAIHCGRGGVALFAPDFVAENFTSGTDHGGHDGARRSMRYLEWRHDPDRSDSTYVVDYAYVWRDRRTVHVEHDRHVEGLFSRDTWLGLLTAAGFDPRVVPFDHSEFEEDERHEVFVCVRRSRRTLQPVTRSSAR